MASASPGDVVVLPIVQRMEWALSCFKLLPLGTARDVLTYLAFHAGKDNGQCWHSQERMAEALGCSPRTVKYAVAQLLKCEIVTTNQERRGDGSWMTVVYTLRYPPTGGKDLHPDRGQSDVAPGAKQRHDGGRSDVVAGGHQLPANQIEEPHLSTILENQALASEKDCGGGGGEAPFPRSFASAGADSFPADPATQGAGGKSLHPVRQSPIKVRRAYAVIAAAHEHLAHGPVDPDDCVPKDDADAVTLAGELIDFCEERSRYFKGYADQQRPFLAVLAAAKTTFNTQLEGAAA